MDDKNVMVIVALICLTIIMCVSMYFGFNGNLRTLIVGVIAGLAGWRIPTKKGGD